MSRPYVDKFREYIENELNLTELYATDEEQDEMLRVDALFDELRELPMAILIDNMSIVDSHLINMIADVVRDHETIDPVHAVVLVMVLYRHLFGGDGPAEAVK